MYWKKILIIIITINFFGICSSEAYPIFAQQNYRSPREANGRIVCANCHLAQKSVELEIPQRVLPDTVFEAMSKIPYDSKVKQVLGNGKLGEINVGAVLILPEGFKISPQERISTEVKERVKGIYFQQYSAKADNILVVGPVPGKKYSEIVFPILAPNPENEKGVEYGKYSVYFGGNRGRGQVYPDGSKSNNNVYSSSVSGKVKEISPADKKGGFKVIIENKYGENITEIIPRGPDLLVKVGQNVSKDEPLTNNPNVGGFGQTEKEIVLQSSARIKALLSFFVVVTITQVLLVLKKKQFEKVQLSEINF